MHSLSSKQTNWHTNLTQLPRKQLLTNDTLREIRIDESGCRVLSVRVFSPPTAVGVCALRAECDAIHHVSSVLANQGATRRLSNAATCIGKTHNVDLVVSINRLSICRLIAGEDRLCVNPSHHYRRLSLRVGPPLNPPSRQPARHQRHPSQQSAVTSKTSYL